MNKASDSKKMIKESGLKSTKNREAVLNFLISKSKPLTVEDVSRTLKINIVTVYRILESFVDKKIIYKTDFRQGKAFFEFQAKDHHHHHITCTKCGFRDHIDFCVETQFTKKIKSTTKFEKIDSHILEFFGVCKKCNSKSV